MNKYINKNRNITEAKWNLKWYSIVSIFAAWRNIISLIPAVGLSTLGIAGVYFNIFNSMKNTEWSTAVGICSEFSTTVPLSARRSVRRRVPPPDGTELFPIFSSLASLAPPLISPVRRFGRPARVFPSRRERQEGRKETVKERESDETWCKRRRRRGNSVTAANIRKDEEENKEGEGDGGGGGRKDREGEWKWLDGEERRSHIYDPVCRSTTRRETTHTYTSRDGRHTHVHSSCG